MTVREWFRGMRRTEHGRSLMLEMDRLLSGRLQIDGPVYGITLVHDFAEYERWEARDAFLRKARSRLLE